MLSLAWLGLAVGGEEEDGEVVAEEEEEGDDEVLSDELKEEDGVLVLHEHNFARALSEHQLLLVEFCESSEEEPLLQAGVRAGVRAGVWVQKGAQRVCGGRWAGTGLQQGQRCGSEGQGHRTWCVRG